MDNMKPYNVIKLSINEALNHVPIGTGGGYLCLLSAPSEAKVLIHLNDSNADGIPLKAYHAIEATNIDKVYITCNAVAGEVIEIVQANTSRDFKMITPASDVKVETVTDIVNPITVNYTTELLDAMDKIVNPYQEPIVLSNEHNNLAQTDVLAKTITCDKIKVFLNITRKNSILSYSSNSAIGLYVDGKYILKAFQYHPYINIPNAEIELNNVYGKTIQIIQYSQQIEDTCSYRIEEYTLKP